MILSLSVVYRVLSDCRDCETVETVYSQTDSRSKEGEADFD